MKFVYPTTIWKWYMCIASSQLWHGVARSQKEITLTLSILVDFICSRNLLYIDN